MGVHSVSLTPNSATRVRAEKLTPKSTTDSKIQRSDFKFGDCISRGLLSQAAAAGEGAPGGLPGQRTFCRLQTLDLMNARLHVRLRERVLQRRISRGGRAGAGVDDGGDGIATQVGEDVQQRLLLGRHAFGRKAA